jgi:hypothetical protein
VLLRVSETANLAAPDNEANAAAAALQRLESARSQLGDSILHNSQRNEAQLVALAAVARSEKAVPDTHKSETVVDDGPGKAPAKHTTKKTTQKKPAPKPAAGTPAGGTAQQAPN